MAFEDARSGRRMLNVLGNPAKEGEGMHMPVDPRLCRRRRVQSRGVCAEWGLRRRFPR